MSEPFGRLRRFLAELKRRNVYKVATTYAVVAFVVWQAASLLFPALRFPAWTTDFVIVLTLLGFPITLVLAWAFEMTPEGVRRTPEAEPTAAETGKAGGDTGTGYKVLIGVGFMAAAVAGGWYLTGGGGESPEVTEGTVAVLPFEVSGSGTEDWRDGMVSMLSTGLDGAAGLRAIADRTVFAAWEQRGSEGMSASTEEALAVARRIGAQYAVVGTAAGLGSKLQLSATAYETTSGKRLGQVEVSGTPDSVTALAGDLTRRVLGLLAAETGEELRAADLASVTTRSDTALRAFLAGERHRRAGNTTPSAVEDYEAAIRADSGFALPYARLAFIGLWHGPFEGQYMRRAHELSDQLPERQRRLVRALYLGRLEHRTLAARDSLRRLTEDYPDDPMIWESLGEFVAHTNIPRGLPEVERAHKRAVELDPENTAYYPHYIESTFQLYHDSALVTKRVDGVPNKRRRRLYRLARDVIFGDSAVRQRALSVYDTVSIPEPWLVSSPFAPPQDLDLRETVLRRVTNREDVDPEPWARRLSVTDLVRGQVEQFLADFSERAGSEDNNACLLSGLLTLGLPVPDSVAARYLAPEHLPDEPSLRRFHCAGVYLVESGRGDELESLIRRLQATVDTTGEDGVLPGKREAVVQELRGYRAWKQGKLERAARLWDRSNESGGFGAIWRGDLYRKFGQLERAEGWYLANWAAPESQERLGQLYEEMGRPEKAAAAYRRFIAAWKNADPELQPRVRAARERLKKLTASEGETND